METKLRYVAPPVTPERALRVLTEPDRNPGIPLDLDLVRALRVNRSAVERRAATIATRRTVKKEWQAAWLLRAISCMDLTTLQSDDTPTNVLRLSAKAQDPTRPPLPRCSYRTMTRRSTTVSLPTTRTVPTPGCKK
ncbi:MAG TPA: hypothetical protein VK531_12710 [Gemmatimonadales bacterium]|nr:hypothetical protein [Gemmatimonadales bacterium]